MLKELVIDKLRTPFRKDWWLWLMLFVPLAVAQIAGLWGSLVFHYIGVYIWEVYLFLLLMNLNKRVRLWLMPPLLLLFVLVCVADLVCVAKFDSNITASFFGTIMNTNTGETAEFFRTYIGWREYLFGIVFVVFYGLLYWQMQKRQIRLFRWGEVLLWLLMLVNIVLVVRHPWILDRMSFFSDEDGYFSLDQALDLRQHRHRLNMVELSNDHPMDVVVVIGEAYTKDHCSLYGYKYDTCPLEQMMIDDSLMHVFTDVEAPATMTFECFKYILNEKTRKDRIAWYNSPNIMEAFSSAGYHTAWVSNQTEKGVCDNLASNQSEFCDTAFFTGNNYNLVDGELFRFPQSVIAPQGEKNFVIYHLMGQHESFESRFPEKWTKFKASMYNAYPENQRQVLADYDNATLYNDFIVNSIIDRYKDKDAIVVYFPDHGADIFASSKDYFGHAKPGDPKSVSSAKRIPFVVYTSTLFRQNHNESVKYIKSVRDKGMNTELFMPLLLRMCNYSHE